MATSDSKTTDTDEKIFIGKGEQPAWLTLALANRHGLVTGATGTGKTVSLQVMAEGFARAGVPVFAADIKGDLCSPTPSRLGILGGDACGFPNGRRLSDDIVEIELLAVAGAAYQVLDGRDAGFTFDPALIGVLDDGVDTNDVPFRTSFPYMGLAQSGQEHFHQNATDGLDVKAAANEAEDDSDYTEVEALDDFIQAVTKLFLPLVNGK